MKPGTEKKDKKGTCSASRKRTIPLLSLIFFSRLRIYDAKLGNTFRSYAPPIFVVFPSLQKWPSEERKKKTMNIERKKKTMAASPPSGCRYDSDIKKHQKIQKKQISNAIINSSDKGFPPFSFAKSPKKRERNSHEDYMN
jgi:hypothetical protein